MKMLRSAVIFSLVLIISCAGQRKVNLKSYYHGSPFTFSAIDLDEARERADYPGASAVYLLREGMYQLEEISTFSEHVVLKILEERGKKYADVKLPFWEECEVLDLKARTIKPNGSVINVDKSDVYEVTDFPEFIMYADRKAKVFSFPSVDTGCVLEYFYTVGYVGPLVPPWYFQSDEPVRLARFTYKVPRFVGFKYVVSSLDGYEVEKETKDAGGSNIGVFVARDLPALKHEPLSSPRNDVTSWILMAWSSLHHIIFGKISSGQESWFQMGRTYTGWVDSLVQVTREIEDKVGEITAGCRSDEEKIRAINSFIRNNCRYVAVEIAGHRIFPNPPVQVLRNQYGDCKDLSGLMIAMLRAANISSYAVLVKTRGSGKLIKTLPTFGQIDHVIVAIPLKYFTDEESVSGAVLRGALEFSKEDDYVMVDPTAQTYPLGGLHSGIQGRNAVICAGLDSRFAELPAGHYTDNVTTNQVQFNVDGTDYHGNIGIEVAGEEAAGIRYQLLHASRAETRDLLQNILSGFPLRISIDTFTLNAISDFDSLLRIDISFKKYSPLQASKGHLLVPVLFTDLPQFRALYDCHERTHNIEFDYPFRRSDMFRLKIPDRYAVFSLPERESVKNEWCEYTCVSYICGDTVIVNRNIAIKECLIPKERFDEIKNFAARVIDSGQKLVVLVEK